jgi:hypothetical protein
MRRTNQVAEIKSHACPVLNIPLSKRIHVMNDQSRVDLMTLETEITTIISNYCLLTQGTPLSRCIKFLINPSIESEGLATHLSSESQIIESIFERFKLDEFGV